MKKIYSFMVAAVALFAAVSCNKEFEQENLPAGETVVYTASVDGAEPEAKAVLNETAKKSEWTATDEITVLDGSGPWTFKSTGKGQNVEFTNSEGFGKYRPVLAVYPKNTTFTADVAAKTVNACIPTYQGAREGTYNENAALAVAYSEGSDFAFKNAHALLKFSVKGEKSIKAIEFYGNNKEAITGNMAVTLNDDNTIKSVVGQNTTFTEGDRSWEGMGTWVKFYSEDEANGWCFKEGVTYYVAIAPADFTRGFTINLILADDSMVEAFKKFNGPLDLKASQILPLGEIEYKAPVVHEWAVAGTFNGWNTTANPMTLEGDYYVAKGVTGLNYTAPTGDETGSSTGIKFVVKGTDWKASEGKVTAGTWAYVWDTDAGSNIYVDGAAADTAYDIYVNPAEGDNGKFVIVAAGEQMPEDKPVEEEVVVGYWAVVGTMSGWEDYAAMTLDGDWHVATNVKLTASDRFKFRADNDWGVNRGAAGEPDEVIIANDVETDVYGGGKNFFVAEGGFYTISINKAATKVKVVKTADLPVESVPDQPSDWALWAEISSEWEQVDMVTTTVPDLFVAKSVTLDAYKSFLVKNAGEEWKTKYGTGAVNYIDSNKYFVAESEGGNITVDAAGTYDIYFDHSTKNVYLMTAGANYTSATLQTVSGDGPPPAGTPSKPGYLYLKRNSNWESAGRYAAYFFGDGVTWVDMTDPDGDGIYEVQIPTNKKYTSVIFCRMNTAFNTNSWDTSDKDYVWDQTVDLTIDSTNNVFTIASGAWNKANGVWSYVAMF